MPPKKILIILFFIPSTISFFIIFKTTINYSTSTPLLVSPIASSPSSNPVRTSSHVPYKLTRYDITHGEDDLTTKEHQLLSNIISKSAPCNLLFFGFKPQFLSLAASNTQGTTVFLEDDEEKVQRVTQQMKEVKIYKVEYHDKASEAYELLRHAREHFGCKFEAIQLLEETGCKLGRVELPKEVYGRKWDVVMVDGPRGDSAEAPGRMTAIYTAAVIARRGKATDVLVHDVHRMIEKWYSWEFLCQENLISSKGKLWHFRIHGKSRSTRFCPEARIQIV